MLVGWLVVFYGTSTFVSYLKPNPLSTFISYDLLADSS